MVDALLIRINSKHCVSLLLIQKLLKNYIIIKDLVMMETSIVKFYQRFYIPKIHNLALHLPHV